MARRPDPTAVAGPPPQTWTATHDVSVVIATYAGAERIGACLRSLADQTLPREQFEVVVVQNGPRDETPAVIAAIQERAADLRIRTIYLASPGAGQARNVGLLAAQGEYVTFLDDDDVLSREYLAALLAHSRPNVVGLGYLASVSELGGLPDFATGASLLQSHTKGVVPASYLTSALGYTAAKMVSTALARSVLFDPTLRSGEDVVFWAQTLAESSFKFGVTPASEHAIYFRTTRANSVSRQQVSYDFNVAQRLEVIGRLDSACQSHPAPEVTEALQRLVDAQLGFVTRFLRAEPDRYEEVRADIASRNFSVSTDRVTHGAARDLAVLYVALPYNDTSSLVAARRVREAGTVVDVLTSDMSAVRDYDRDAVDIWSPYVDKHYETKTRPSNAGWPNAADFCWKGLERIEEWEEKSGPYRRVYSRAMWPASHLLAGLYKIRNPDVHWVAEFSDPLSHDIHGKIRESNGEPDPDLITEFRDELTARGFTQPTTDNLFAWSELLAYALADELLFTNHNQREYMLGCLTDQRLHARALARATVTPHPTLPESYYQLRRSNYALDPTVVNIGYFGLFYATRGLTEVVQALRTMDPQLQRQVKLHIFTSKPDELRHDAQAAGVGALVVANPYVGYLEFLNLTTKFHALLVNDTRTAESHSANPYLPSKYSDYAGSGRPIWGVIEPDSVLSEQRLDYVSELGDVAGARAVLERMVGELLGPRV